MKSLPYYNYKIAICKKLIPIYLFFWYPSIYLVVDNGNQIRHSKSKQKFKM